MSTTGDKAKEVSRLLEAGKFEEANALAKQVADLADKDEADALAPKPPPPPRPEPQLFELILRELAALAGHPPRLTALFDELDRGRALKVAPAKPTR